MRLSMIFLQVVKASMKLWKMKLWEKYAAAKEAVACAVHAHWKTFLVILGVVMVVSILWGGPRAQVKSYRAHLPSDAVSKLTPNERIQLEKDLIQAENNARVTLAQILGGLGLLTGLYLTWRNIRVAEDGKITDRYSKAIELLGSEKMNVRIGGIYALERIAKDSEKDHWTVMEALTAYVRERSPSKNKQESKQGTLFISAGIEFITADVQAALTVIGRRKWIRQEKQRHQMLDFKGANLCGGRFTKASLSEANFQDADLCAADLSLADLSNAKFGGATLLCANLNSSNLSNAFFFMADLGPVDLRECNLRGAHLIDVRLFGSLLKGADLRGAHLVRTDLRRVDFLEVDLCGATLRKADLGKARNLTWEQIQKADIDEHTKLPPELEAKRKEGREQK